MMKLLNNISAFWIIVLPVAITLILLFSILPGYLESHITRITRHEIDRSLLGVSRRIETTLRTLMINNPRKVKDFHRLLDSLRGDPKVIDRLNQPRQERIDQLDNALRLISKEESFQVAEKSAVNKLWQKYGRQMQKITLLPTQPELRATIIPAPVVREEMLENGITNHPERYPRPDEIETLVIATGRQYRGNVTIGQQPYRQVTSPILAGAACMNCHLSAIEGQPLAAITVRSDLTKNRSAISTLIKRVLMFGALIILFVVLVVLLTTRYLVASLDKLKHQLLRFDEGDTETPISSKGMREIVSLANGLESVRTRTHDYFYSILKNFPALIFMVDKEGNASKDYSPLVQDLFGMIENQNVNEIIFKPQGTDISPILEMVFEENASMSFKEVTSLAPGELQIKGEIFKLIFHPIYQGDPQKLVKILIIGENITVLKQMGEARAEEDKQNRVIIEIVKNPAGFLEFYKESRRLLESGQIIMKRGAGVLREVELIEIRRILNTVKKTSRIFQIQNLEPLANDNKDRPSEMINSTQSINRKKVAPILAAMIRELDKNYGIYQKYVGEQEQKDLITITKNEAQQLSDKHPDLQAETSTWQQRLQLDFIRRKAISVVQATAYQLGKEVKLDVDGEEGRISERTTRTISLTLTHLLRNAIRYGIEDPMIREEVGKWPQGTISIQVQNKGNNIQIRIKDDGKGIHAKDLVSSAIESGLMIPGTKLDPQKTLNLIFEPGFSTVKKSSRTSRRDLGLDTVRSAIRKNKGIITVRSEAGVGTEFIVILHRNP
ncbi:MAG: hypothetical protein HOD85_10930 [Deltaproteobacteria bacterium]|nr:hypothetical protein [Deltaproteobacteria bacterium]